MAFRKQVSKADSKKSKGVLTASFQDGSPTSAFLQVGGSSGM